MSVTTSYDPFNRDVQREAEALTDERAAHQRWSLEQSRIGRDAMTRDNKPTLTWLKEQE